MTPRLVIVLTTLVLFFTPLVPAVQAQQRCDAGNPCPPGLFCNGRNICEPANPSVQQGGGQTVTLANPLGTTDLKTLILRILDFVIYLGSIIVVFMLVYVGFLFVRARGNPDAINEAKSALLWTVIGALILLGAKAIALGIEATVKALSVGS